MTKGVFLHHTHLREILFCFHQHFLLIVYEHLLRLIAAEAIHFVADLHVDGAIGWDFFAHRKAGCAHAAEFTFGREAGGCDGK